MNAKTLILTSTSSHETSLTNDLHAGLPGITFTIIPVHFRMMNETGSVSKDSRNNE